MRIFLDNGYRIILKPHPRSSDTELQELLELNSERVSISTDTIDDNLRIVDLALSFTSSGIFKAIAQKVRIIHYLPHDFLYSDELGVPENEIHRALYFKNYNNKELWLDRYCPRVGTAHELELLLQSGWDSNAYYNNFLKSFNPNGSTKRIIDELKLISSAQ